jgi:hypothetical protein
MSAIYGERLTLGQENGPDVVLAVFGDENYARYETEEGYSVVYDNDLGRFCYALLVDGRFISSGAPVPGPPPTDAVLHGSESDEARVEAITRRRAARAAVHRNAAHRNDENHDT